MKRGPNYRLLVWGLQISSPRLLHMNCPFDPSQWWSGQVAILLSDDWAPFVIILYGSSRYVCMREIEGKGKQLFINSSIFYKYSAYTKL